MYSVNMCGKSSLEGTLSSLCPASFVDIVILKRVDRTHVF